MEKIKHLPILYSLELKGENIGCNMTVRICFLRTSQIKKEIHIKKDKIFKGNLKNKNDC